MTPTLEETIRGLAARGEISDLSLSMNSSHTKWRACYVPCSQFGQSFAEDLDPIKAIMMALTTIKLKSKRAPTDREIAAADALSTAKIDQATVDVVPDEYLAGIQARTTEAEIDDLM